MGKIRELEEKIKQFDQKLKEYLRQKELEEKEKKKLQQQLALEKALSNIIKNKMQNDNEVLNRENKNLRDQLAQNNMNFKNFQDQLFQMENRYENKFIGMKREYEAKISEINNREQQKAIQLQKEKENAITECATRLTEEFKACINNSINEYNIISKKWINQISNDDIENIKNNFKILFRRLFDLENIQNKITNKFIEIIKKNYLNKELKTMNFMVIGASGVGKSTLINALFRENLAKEGKGRACTTEIKKYKSENTPFLCLYDSVGAELGNNYTLEDVQNETINVIIKQLENPDPNQHIHCIIYCVSFNRFYEEEAKIILKLREKYDGKKLPIVIVYTMANSKSKANFVKESVNKFLKKNGESISEDISDSFGINFVEIYSKEALIEVSDIENFQECFGLSNLISICYKKGEKSYKIAIKNSLIEIAKNYFINNINNIVKEFYLMSNQLANFLGQNFDKNFQNFISLLFEKLTNFDNYTDIKNNIKINSNNIIKELNNSNLLQFILNNNSKSEIDKLIKVFKNEMISIMNKNYDTFTREQAQKIYHHLLEKFNKINKNKNVNTYEALKTEEQYKKEAIQEIKINLKDIPEQNFLKNSAIIFFRDIIEIFEKELKDKIYEFVDNLKNNQQIQENFKSIDVFESTKEIEIGKDFKKYIEKLKEIEKQSHEKALKFREEQLKNNQNFLNI